MSPSSKSATGADKWAFLIFEPDGASGKLSQMSCFQSSKDPPGELGSEGFPAATLATDIACFAAGLALQVVGTSTSLGRVREIRNGQYGPVISTRIRIDHDLEELPEPADCLGTLGGGGKRHSCDKPRFSRQINGMANPSGSNASSQHRLHSKRHWQKYFPV